MDILVKEGSHLNYQEVNKQMNDKERVAAALEKDNLRSIVSECIGR